jgi:hypothetical protein
MDDRQTIERLEYTKVVIRSRKSTTYCLSVVHWRLLITTYVYSNLSIVCLSSIEGFWLPLWYTQAFLLSVCRPLKASDYYFAIFKLFYCLSVVDWWLLITTLVYSSLSIVCLSSIEGFWLLLWYIQAFLLSVCRPLKASDDHFGIFKPFYCLRKAWIYQSGNQKPSIDDRQTIERLEYTKMVIRSLQWTTDRQ